MPDPERGPKGSNFLARYAPAGLVPVAVVGGAFLSSCRGETQPSDVSDQHVLVEPLDPKRDALEVDGYKFIVNSDGIPQGYTDPKGEYTRFNMAKMSELRENATRDRLPEVVGLIKIENPSDDEREISYDEKVRPFFKELPEDVLSEEELAQHGVRIIQAENSKLNIRQSAFEEGGSLAHLEQKGRKLIISLVDGNAISRDLMKDSRYDEVRQMLPETNTDPKKYLEKRLNELEIAVNQSIADAEQAKNEVVLDAALHFVLEHKTYLEAYKSGFITEEQLEHEEAEKNAFYSGKYFSPKYSGIDNTEVVFVPVGRSDSRINSLRMYFSETGKFSVDKFVVSPPINIGGNEEVCIDDGHSVVCISNEKILPDYSPDASQGFPSVEMLQKKYDGNYLYYQLTAGQVLNHELGHSVSDSDISEQKADEHMRDKFKSQNFDFYFSLTDGNGYILTADRALLGLNRELA